MYIYTTTPYIRLLFPLIAAQPDRVMWVYNITTILHDSCHFDLAPYAAAHWVSQRNKPNRIITS
jgi:hypothetical protein